MYGSLFLAALVFAPFTRTAERQDGAPPSGATIAAAAGGARLDHAHARSASFDITPPTLSGITSRLRSVFLGVLDNEARAAEDVSLFPGPFDLHLMQVGGAWIAYAEPGGKLLPANGAIEEPDGLPGQQPRFRRGSGCWWLWLFTGMQACWKAHA